MLSKLKKNDHVVTIGGIHGTIVAVRDKEIVLKVDESSNLKLKFARSAIAKVLGGTQGTDEDEE
jgi:preprotein translocase subunit YajC